MMRADGELPLFGVCRQCATHPVAYATIQFRLLAASCSTIVLRPSFSEFGHKPVTMRMLAGI